MKKRTIKVQLYFNSTQKYMALTSEGCARFVFNRALFLKKDRYDKFQENLNFNELSWMFTIMRKSDKYSWMSKVSRSIIEQSLKNLDKAYSGFFKLKKGFPRFKKKGQNVSFILTDPSKIISSNHIKLPKFGVVKMRGLRNFKGDIKNVTISRVGNKYYATFCTEDVVEKKKKIKKKPKIIGIDVNLENFLTDSNGTRIENPRIKKDHVEKIKFYQRKASKCIKGSQRKKRWNLKIQREYQKIDNKKQDFTHKLSNYYVKNHDFIIVENLQIQNMIKNHKLAEAISMVSWGEFFRQLEYKSGFYGSCFIRIPPHNTSKKCSVCGVIHHNLTLNDREWTCEKCKTVNIRDLNAAINVKNMGEGIIQKAIGDTNFSWVCDIGNYLKITHKA